MHGIIVAIVTILFDEIEELHNHIWLWTMELAVGSGRDEDGFVFGKIRVEPNFDLALLGDEDHFLADIKVSYLFIQNFKPWQGSFSEVKNILIGDVVDFLEPEVYFLGVEESFVDSRADILLCGVDKVLNGVDVGWQVKIIFSSILYYTIGLGRLHADA